MLQHGSSHCVSLGQVPLFIAERAGATGLQPFLNAVQVEDVATGSPSNTEARVVRIPCRICLILDAWLVQVVSADGAGVRADLI